MIFGIVYTYTYTNKQKTNNHLINEQRQTKTKHDTLFKIILTQHRKYILYPTKTLKQHR